jgi:uncharacterized membrane protein
MVKRKLEGVESLIKVEDVSLNEMTLIDFFVAFSLLNTIQSDNPEQDARRAYDRAEALVRERFLRS